MLAMRSFLAGNVPPVVQSNFALSANDFDTVSSTSTMPTGGSISRAGQAMYYDSTGKLTYAPNNLLLNSNTLSTQSVTTAAINYILSFSGTGSVALSGAYTGNLAGTGVSNRVSLVFTSTAASLTLTVTGSVTSAQLEAVTYQTTPSTYVATTASAYYGPRFDYDPSTLAVKGMLIEGTRTNLLTYSDQFDNAAWTKTNSTITANATTAPDGTSNADKIVEDATTGVHGPQQGFTSSAAYYTASVYAKASERSIVCVRMFDATAGAGYATYFNLSTGAVGTNIAGNIASIQSVGNGWYRCLVTRYFLGGGGSLVQVFSCATDGTFSFAGTSGSGLFAWGAQLELANFASSYIPTVASTVTRAAETFSVSGYSANLINATYIDEQTGVTSVQPYNAGVAPSPSFSWLTALRVYTNAYAGSISTPSWLSFSRTGNAMVTDSTGTLTWAPSNMLLNSATLSTQTVTVTSGATNLLSFSGTGSITYSGAASGTLTGTGANNRVSVVLTMSTTSLTLTVSGTVTNAQLERVTYQTAPSAYIPTTSAAVYGPRYDYDPSTVPATPRGLLIEEQRANLATYSQDFSNSAWSKLGTLVSASGTAPDGSTANKLIADNTASVKYTDRAIATVASTNYSWSVYMKAGEYTSAVIYFISVTTPFENCSASINLTTGAVTASSAGGGATLVSATTQNVGNGWWRVSLVGNIAAKTNMAVRIYPNTSTSFTGDNTSGIFIWGAQLEAGSFATSYIPTTTASVTRAADVAQLTGSALTTLQGTQATLIAEAISASTSAKYLISARKIASGNYGDFYSLLSTYSTIYAGSAEQASMGYIPLPTTTSIFRAAFAIQSNNFAAVANNGTVQTDTSGNIVTGIDQGWLGGYSDGVYLNGYVRSLALYNQRLPNAILKQKSAVNAPY